MLKAFHQAIPAQCSWNQLRRKYFHSLMVEAVYPKSFHSVALPQKRAFIKHHLMYKRLPSQTRTGMGHSGIKVCRQILIQCSAEVNIQKLKPSANTQYRDALLQGRGKEGPFISVTPLTYSAYARSRFLSEKRWRQIFTTSQQQSV